LLQILNGRVNHRHNGAAAQHEAELRQRDLMAQFQGQTYMDHGAAENNIHMLQERARQMQAAQRNNNHMQMGHGGAHDGMDMRVPQQDGMSQPMFNAQVQEAVVRAMHGAPLTTTHTAGNNCAKTCGL
jgi:hypothetical protein